ncbi:hypothetical protein L1987_54487 [Smallanthus sonchifolius]|uniref:Uncharacterized protein n=1 Tax=Smallanthus sonchifolius TaxID=185202 RepID=A0ACB9E704_9ASTR|nr:hypothetical protein L1987_54487 [Smallanthus sonchifolius]
MMRLWKKREYALPMRKLPPRKKKKKAIVETDDCAIKGQSEVTDKRKNESSKNSGEISRDIIVDELETKSNKKKTKHDLVSSTDEAINGLKVDYLTKKIKEKKKKNIEVKLELSATNEEELETVVVQKEKKKKKKPSTDENETIQPDVTKKEKKSSKKRKRSDENENQNENENENVSNKQFDGETNEKLELDGVKSKKKHRNVTSEDGAEIGYGAKAQEVLGQVRGRDFRHEKTKKKRGSYRGGLINQQSHSIKFNYSDEE